MDFPDFFTKIPPIIVVDRLAELLGSTRDGLLEYHFADAVKLAGHSCPTVAGAWLTTVRALRALYGDETPQRGRISVALSESLDSGVAGVIGSVAGLITGAAGSGGFKGLDGQHVRRNLLQFGISGAGSLRFTRLDTNVAVDCVLRLDFVPGDSRIGTLLPAILHGQSSAGERRLFAELWQERVRRILVEHGDDPRLVELQEVPH